MIQLTTPLFDPLGAVTLNEMPDSDMSGVSRRINRVATLDGGSVLNDRGYTASDRTFAIRWRIRDRAEMESVKRMVRLHGRVRVANREGVFMGAPEDAQERDGIGTLTILILEQET